MRNGAKHERRTTYLLAVLGLPALSAFFLWLEHQTHFEFLLHAAAIPLEILAGAFVVERWLARREKEGKRRQLMYIKSHLFRAEMRNVFISNFDALVSPALSLRWIRDASLAELVRAREGIASLEYRSPQAVDAVIAEYARARGVFQTFMEWAVANDFDAIFQDMIRILHFIQDYLIFTKRFPGNSFAEHARHYPRLQAKLDQVLRDGIVKFLDYAIELGREEPEVLEELLDDYVLSAAMWAESAAGAPRHP